MISSWRNISRGQLRPHSLNTDIFSVNQFSPQSFYNQLWQQVRTVFIQTTETPNPESIKFIPTGIPVLTDTEKTGNGFYVTKNGPTNDILRSPLANKMFSIEGVKAVYLGTDFVTITKFAEYKWKLLRPQIFELMMEWADSGKPALLDEPVITDTTILDDDDEVVAMIKELIESRIRPAVQEDGGDIRYVGFEEETGIVTVRLAGSCVGCPSSSVTLKQGVENMLMHYIPEVTAVVSEEEQEVNDEPDPSIPKQKSYEEKLAQAGIPFSD